MTPEITLPEARFQSISQDFLNLVGLSQDVISNFAKENRQELLEKLNKGLGEGGALYNHLQRQTALSLDIPYTDNPLNTISILRLSLDVVGRYNAADIIINKWQEKQKDLPNIDSEILEKMDTYIMEFVEGFGEAAFAAKDWGTAVNTFDAISENGVENSQKFKTKLDSLPLERNDYQSRLQIAGAIKGRMKQKDRTSSSSS